MNNVEDEKNMQAMKSNMRKTMTKNIIKVHKKIRGNISIKKISNGGQREGTKEETESGKLENA